MTEYEVFTKEPSEAFDIGLDFARALKSGSVIATIPTYTAIRLSDSSNVTSTVLEAPTFSGTILSARIKAGNDGERIKITFKITTNDNPSESHEGGLICEIREI